MTARRSAAESEDAGSLDPFALPTETRGRFHILMVTACLLVWSLPSYFVGLPEPTEEILSWELVVTPEERELLERVATEGWTGLSRSEMAVLMAVSDRHGGLERRRQVFRSLCSVGLVLLVLLGAVFMAWLRQVDQPPLLRGQAPRVFRDLDACCRRFGIVPTPRLALRAGLLDGLAVAGPDGPVLVLAGDRHRLDLCWNDLYRSVLLHELGHLVNGDFHVRELARWMWRWAGGLVVVASIVLMAQKRFLDAGALTLRSAVFAAVIYLLWSALVRDRELYADLRTVTWGYGAALARRLALPAAHGAPRSALGRRLRSMGLWRMLSASRHPSNEERSTALAQPDRPFRLSLRLSVAAGLLLSIASAGSGAFFRDLLLPMGLLGALLSFLPIAGVWVVTGVLLLTLSLVLLWLGALVVASLGVQAMRGGIYGAWTSSGFGKGLLRLWLPTSGLITGFQVGLLPWTGLERSAVPSLGTFWLSVAAVWLWLGCLYCAGYWVLPAIPGPKRPKWLSTLTLLTGAVLWVPAVWPLAGRWLWAAGDGLLHNFGVEGSAFGVQFLLTLLSAGFIVAVVLAYGTVALLTLWRRRCARCGDRPRLRLGLRERCGVCDAYRETWLRWRADPCWLDLDVSEPARGASS